MNLKGVGVGLPLSHMVMALVVALMIVTIATHDFSQTGYFAKGDREQPSELLEKEAIASVPEQISITKESQEEPAEEKQILDFSVMSTNVSDCMNLSTAGVTYTLNKSITGNQSDGMCIDVQADNVTLDCKGYKITGNALGNTYGVYAVSYNNTTIKNCDISNYSTGIYSFNSNYDTLTNNTAYNNSGSGIYLDYSSNDTLANNKVYINSYDGISLYFSSNNTVMNNTAHGNAEYGIYIFDSENNTVINSTAYDNEDSGIYLFGSANNNVSDNVACSIFAEDVGLDSTSSSNSGDNICNNLNDYDSNSVTCSQKCSGINVSQCASLVTANQTYTLKTNLTGNQSGGYCIDIQVDNVTLDCAGYNLKGGETAVYASGLNNLTVKNCKLINYTTGIELYSVNASGLFNNTIYFTDNSTVHSNTTYSDGIILSDNYDVHINNSKFYNLSTSLNVGQSSNILVYNNTINDSANLEFYNVSYSNMTYNKMGVDYAFIDNSYYVLVDSNVLRSIDMMSSYNNTITSNNFSTDCGAAITFDDWSDIGLNWSELNNTVSGNKINVDNAYKCGTGIATYNITFSAAEMDSARTANTINSLVEYPVARAWYFSLKAVDKASNPVGGAKVNLTWQYGNSWVNETTKSNGHWPDNDSWVGLEEIFVNSSGTFNLTPHTITVYVGRCVNTTVLTLNHSFTNYTVVLPCTSDNLNWSTFKGSESRAGSSLSIIPYYSTSRKWNYTVANVSSSGSPVVQNNVLYFCTINGFQSKLYAINVTNGSPIANKTLYDDCYATPTVENGIIYLVHGGRVSAFNATNISNEKWHNDTSAQIDSPLVYSNYVYVGNASSFFAFNKTDGTLVGEYALSGMASTAAYGDGKVIFASGSKVYALDYSDVTTKIWDAQLDGTSYSSPAVLDNIVFVGDEAGYLYALNISDGSQLWNYSTGKAIRSSPSVRDGVVYFTTNSSAFALNFTSSAVSQKWNRTEVNNSMDLPFFSSPVISGDRVVIASSDGGFLVLYNTNGSIIWSKSQVDVIATPALANDYMYVITNDSANLTAYTAEDVAAPVIAINYPTAGSTTSGNIPLNITTDEPANCSSRVTGEGSFTQMNITGSYSHSRMLSINTSGAKTASIECKDYGFPTPNTGTASVAWTVDASPPVMSNIKEVNITISSAVITWTTNEPANYTLEYGATTAYGSSVSNSTLSTSHVAELSGLSEGELYHFRINSSDNLSNKNTTGDKFFVVEQRLFYDLNAPDYNDTHPQTKMNLTIYVKGNGTVSGEPVYISQSQDDPTGTFQASKMDKFYNISASQNLRNVLAYYDLKINYTQPTFNESTIKVFFYSNTTGWTAVSAASDVNTTANYVKARLTHFSYFAVGGLLSNGDNCTANGQCVDNICATIYNSTQKVCVPSGRCAKSPTDWSYNSSYKFCSGNSSAACMSSGSWDTTNCGSSGCNTTTGACISGGGGNGSTGGEGGAGGGGNFTPINQSTSVDVILPFSTKKGTPQTVQVASSAMDIRELTLSVNTDLPSGSQLEISQYDDVPIGVTASPNDAYRYFYFSALNLPYSMIDVAKIKFRVSKTWMSDNSVSESSIKLYRRSTDWTALDTSKVNFDSNYTYYEAITPAFSYFAITGSVVAGGAQPSQQPEENITSPTTPTQTFVPATACGDGTCNGEETVATCPADCKATPAAVAGAETSFLIIGGVIGAIAGVAILIFIFVIRPRLEEQGALPKEAYPAFTPAMPPAMPMLKVETVMELPPEKEHELEGYVRRNLARGFTPQMIRANMVKVGWTLENVNTAFELVTTPPEKEMDLASYVVRMQQKGFTTDQISQRLLQAGWSKKKVRHIVGIASKKLSV